MADDEEQPREIPESAHGYGKHDRVKRGYWPEKFGDQVVSIDIDHPQAHLVRSREELEAAQQAAEREAAENEGRLAELLERERQEQEDRQLRERIEDVVSNSSTSSDVEEVAMAEQPVDEQHADSTPPAPKPSRRSR